LQASLRLRPDRIILGELRGGEGMSFLRAVNTGHAGSLTSIHADSPEGALEQLALIVMQGAAACRGRTSCIMRAASSTLWCNWSGGRGGGDRADHDYARGWLNLCKSWRQGARRKATKPLFRRSCPGG
jgi:hypothetical protein